MRRRRCLTSFWGKQKKGTAGRRERERPNEGETDATERPNRERHFQMQMKNEWLKKRMREGGGREGGRGGGRGERNNKSVIDRGRAARREWQ